MAYISPKSIRIPRQGWHFSLRCLFAVVTVAALVAFWHRPPVLRASLVSVRIATPSLEEDGYTTVTFCLRNDAPNSLWYPGFSNGEIASYSTQFRHGARWVEAVPFRCGFDRERRRMELKPKMSRYFTVKISKAAGSFKCGVSLATDSSRSRAEQDRVVWSDEVRLTGRFVRE